MDNKTCGECKHFSCSDEGQCMDNEWTFCSSDACDKFQAKVVTNGDKLRQMSTDELATAWSEQAFLFAWCYDCMGYCKDGGTPENILKCKNRMLNWLNAPAESEGEDE